MDLNEKWAEHIKEDRYGNPDGWLTDELGYEKLVHGITGESRWGIYFENVYKSPEGELVGLDYEDAAAEGEYDADMMNAEFYPVEAREVTKVEYVRV